MTFYLLAVYLFIERNYIYLVAPINVFSAQWRKYQARPMAGPEGSVTELKPESDDNVLLHFCARDRAPTLVVAVKFPKVTT